MTNCSSAIATHSVGLLQITARVALLRKNAAHQIGSEQPVWRKQRHEALAVVEAADRRDLRVSGSAREQRAAPDRSRSGRCGVISRVRSATMPMVAAAHRQHDDLAALLAMSDRSAIRAARATRPAAANGPRSVTTPSTAVSARGTSDT